MRVFIIYVHGFCIHVGIGTWRLNNCQWLCRFGGGGGSSGTGSRQSAAEYCRRSLAAEYVSGSWMATLHYASYSRTRESCTANPLPLLFLFLLVLFLTYSLLIHLFLLLLLSFIRLQFFLCKVIYLYSISSLLYYAIWFYYYSYCYLIFTSLCPEFYSRGNLIGWLLFI